MTLTSNPVLLLLAMHGIWLVICLIIKMFDFVLSIILAKLPNDEIVNMYLCGAIAINVIYAAIMILHIIKQ